MPPVNCKVVSCNVMYDRWLHLGIIKRQKGKQRPAQSGLLSAYLCIPDERMGCICATSTEVNFGSRSLPVNPTPLAKGASPHSASVSVVTVTKASRTPPSPLTPAFRLCNLQQTRGILHDLPCSPSLPNPRSFFRSSQRCPTVNLPTILYLSSVNTALHTHYIRKPNSTHITAQPSGSS